MTGLLASAVQLLLLGGLLHLDLRVLPANALAFALAAQVNFALSYGFTWSDRRDVAPSRPLVQWFEFLSSISSTAVLNLAVFAFASSVLPAMLAAASGIGSAACLNFLLGDRLVFRATRRPFERAQRGTLGHRAGAKAASNGHS
jgi:putative flippase GtrA